MVDIKSMTLTQLENVLKCMGEPSYRSTQIFKWLQHGSKSFDDMSNISNALKYKLKTEYFILTADIEKKFVSKEDDTKKYLLRLNDGNFVESVLMKYKYGYSLCISTQVGCKMGCSFCATGKCGFIRNLTASEMISQINAVEGDIGQRISHVVLMGMGEPLDNYDNVLIFLELVSSSYGLNISMRHISLSTCGIVDKIYSLANKKLCFTLSVSLHAPNDKIRNKIMRINNRFKVYELIKACDFYFEKTKRRISYEYAMINGVNDSDECAQELSRLLRGKVCHVNLIPINTIDKSGFKRSSLSRIEKFKGILLSRGINVTVRRSLGKDINASCGQLQGKIKKEESIFESI